MCEGAAMFVTAAEGAAALLGLKRTTLRSRRRVLNINPSERV
jgi:hypothetical protein